MKKTISITIGGMAFTIEEDAYQALDAYVTKIRTQFTDDPNVDELVADMETGIADVFAKKAGKRKELIITLADVHGMMATMGEPEQIAGEDVDPKASETHARPDVPANPKRLYRSTDDVVIAGVCSGLAAYFGIDPVIVRIIFIILAFANGFGILAYIIFWIAMPEATTSAQKLEMRGKPVNLSEIEVLVKEKATKMSDEGKKAWERMQDAKSPARRFLEVPIRFVGACARAVVKVVSVVIKIAGGTLGVVLTAAASIAIAAATVTGTVLLFSIQSPYIQSDFPLHELIGNPRYYVAVVAAYLVIVIPLVFLIQLGSFMLTRRNPFQTTTIIILTVLWFVAASAAAAMGLHLVPWALTHA